MKKTISFTIVLLVLFINFTAFAFEHPGGMHPEKQIESVKKLIKAKSQPTFGVARSRGF